MLSNCILYTDVALPFIAPRCRSVEIILTQLYAFQPNVIAITTAMVIAIIVMAMLVYSRWNTLTFANPLT